MQLEESQAGEEAVSVPMKVAHCWSRDVQRPEAHCTPLSPQDCPSGELTSAGQPAALPEQTSCGSQEPVLARQTVPLFMKPHCGVQHSSLVGSHTLPVVYLHVLGSQQGLLAHP